MYVVNGILLNSQEGKIMRNSLHDQLLAVGFRIEKPDLAKAASEANVVKEKFTKNFTVEDLLSAKNLADFKFRAKTILLRDYCADILDQVIDAVHTRFPEDKGAHWLFYRIRDNLGSLDEVARAKYLSEVLRRSNPTVKIVRKKQEKKGGK